MSVTETIKVYTPDNCNWCIYSQVCWLFLSIRELENKMPDHLIVARFCKFYVKA